MRVFGELACELLGEDLAGWGRENDGGCGIRPFDELRERGYVGGRGFVEERGFCRGACRSAEDAVEGLAPGLGLHDHAGSTAVRSVVDCAVSIVREVAQIVHFEVNQATLTSLAEKGDVEHGEDRKSVV